MIERKSGVGYSRHIAEVVSSATFDTWLRKLQDRHARLRILERIDRLAHGNPGDTRAVGAGVAELRLTYGPGYRVYYIHSGGLLIVLLCGGDKSSQHRDIERAHRLAGEWQAQKEAHDGDHP
ncbi:type II toxin-antitoxin system RelE/ParE family toxin [Aeromicrobium phoceense]|uniref:type II toxin-antitoxin system RelE/ParE family toxin n=1 Tax=Aeromicrobium phoceense TaxID=2754045 RepID=UPI001892C545|nr:type II toxin-antitoxin system RelE/ParE family toxin [Aeromicrobium phoceense]